MSPLLKNLLGNDVKDREFADEMREVLQQLQQERERGEALVKTVRAAAEKLLKLNEPIEKAGTDVDAVGSRVADMERRLAALTESASRLDGIDERSQRIAQAQERAETGIAGAVEDAQRVRSTFEEMAHKVDIALGLKDRLEAFLEVEKPFDSLRGEAQAIRAQQDGVGEQLARLRDQHDRLMDAHKLAMSKMEAMDRRRDDLGRSLTDKERRVATVEQTVRGMDGVQQTVAEIKREIGALKALGDSVVQKSAAMEAQREAVERALAQASDLDRAMRQVDSGVRQQQENEKSLAALQEQVSALRALHEAVVERSAEISQLQHETEEQTRSMRLDLSSLTDEMRKTVERFDFEGRGLESVSQRVADLRAALTDCEGRFKGLGESSLAVGELRSQTKSLNTQLQGLTEELGHADAEVAKFAGIRRDLEDTRRTATDLGARMAQIEERGPAVEAALRDLAQLSGAHAVVRDALEQTLLAHAEISRVRESQSEARTWMAGVEQSVEALRAQAGDLHKLAPTVEVVQAQAQRLGESVAAIESRREFVEDLHKRLADLAALGGKLDERGKQLQSRMESAEQRFTTLGARSEDAERLSLTIANVSAQVQQSERRSDEIGKAVSAIASRCESVEALAERTRALKPELEQRQQALKEASKDLQRASSLRKDGAAAAAQLDETSQRLSAALAAADQQVVRVDDVSRQLEERAAGLRTVEKRLSQFEERLAQWAPVEQEIVRSLEQIASRQGTVESLHQDLERMFTLAEKTAADVREVTSAQQEIEQSRRLLTDVMGKLNELKNTASTLEERKRQMGKAEERLARAEALIADVRSSLEALQGQKAFVDQAVEKVGSLQFLLKQAEATIDGLREEREMSARVRAAVAIEGEDDDEVGKAA